MTPLLDWSKPKKARTTEEHNTTFVADGAPPGTYVPNMSDEDKRKWKAKRVGGKDPRVEIRKTATGRARGSEKQGPYAQVKLVVRPDKSVRFSANGKAELDVIELIQALDEAYASLVLGSGQTRCQSENPETGSQCIMAQGHVGPHCTGSPYRHNQEERWVTKCKDEPCIYHEAFVHNPGYEECIHCGDARKIEGGEDGIDEADNR